MLIGVPKEVKTDEYRVALTPAGVRELIEPRPRGRGRAHAGVGSSIGDDDYTAVGARSSTAPTTCGRRATSS